jgi:hypothetical protein
MERSKKLRVPRVNRKSILCAVLALAIIGMFLMPAASVTAATQDWPLQLVGATTINVTQAEFEAMAAANPSNTYTDSDNHTWRGVGLWRLIALVDDSDNTTFNGAVASVYSIKMTASDNYSKTIAPPYASVFNFANSEDIFVANQVKLAGTADFVQLPLTSSSGKVWYPLRVNGSGCTANNQRVGGLIKIELLNLPVTTVSVSPSTQGVANGASSTVNLAINTNQQSRGWQTNVDFDATKLQCTGVTEGGFLKDYATANGGSTIAPTTPTIDNTGGHVTNISYAITGAGTGGPTGTGTLCTLAFTAKAGVSGNASITPSAIVVTDASGNTIPGAVSVAGQVAISYIDTVTTVVSSADPLGHGKSVTFTATVSAVASGTRTPTGTVQFQIDDSDFGSPVALENGSATSDAIKTLSAGDHTVKAVYVADAGFNTSTGTVDLTVNKAPTPWGAIIGGIVGAIVVVGAGAWLLLRVMKKKPTGSSQPK